MERWNYGHTRHEMEVASPQSWQPTFDAEWWNFLIGILDHRPGFACLGTERFLEYVHEPEN